MFIVKYEIGFFHKRKCYWRVNFYYIYWCNYYWIYLPIQTLPFFLYLWCLNSCESYINNLILIQFLFKPREHTFAKVAATFVSGITSLDRKSPLLFNFLWPLINSLGVGGAFFSYSLMCLASYLDILNPFISTNTFPPSKFYNTFYLSISLVGYWGCSSTIVLYFPWSCS